MSIELDHALDALQNIKNAAESAMRAIEAAKAPATEQAGETSDDDEMAENELFFWKAGYEACATATKQEPLSLTKEERAKLKNIIQIATYEAKNGLHMGEAGRAADKVLDALSERYDIRRKGDVQSTRDRDTA